MGEVEQEVLLSECRGEGWNVGPIFQVTRELVHSKYKKEHGFTQALFLGASISFSLSSSSSLHR